MKNKNTAGSLTIVVLILASGLPVNAIADKTMEVDLRFAGAFTSGILHADPMTGTTVASALIRTTVVGNLGRGVGQGSGAGGGSIPEVTTSCLGADGLFLRIIATENPLVTTFDDLSLLFNEGAGEICLDLMTGNSVFRFDIIYTGGRGRFEGATGYAVIEGEAEPVSADGSFMGETGTIIGWITVPDDDRDDDSDSDSDSD